MNVGEKVFFREALRESEERHRLTLQTAMDGFLRADMQGRILEVNETYCRMSGYSEQELLTRSFADIEAILSGEMIAAKMSRLAELRADRIESVHRRKDGSLFDVEISGQYQPIAGGQIVVFVRDITERKRAEEALRRSEAYLAEAQRLSHTGSWAFDLAGGKYVYVSEECFRIFGLDAQEGLPNREAVSRLIHPEDWDRVNGDFEKLLREKVDNSSEFRIVLPDGTVKHIQAIRHPVLNSAGDVVRIVGTTIDMTERKRVEEERRQSAERFRAIADYTFDWENWIGVDGKLLWVNPAVERITGYSVGECTAMPDFPIPIVAEADRETVARHIREAVQGSSRNDFEFRVRHKDGHLAWVAASWQPIYDSRGARLGHRSSIRDIAERKQAQEKMRQQEMELRRVLDVTPQLVAVYGPDKERLYANRPTLDYFGVTLEEWQSISDPFWVFHPDDRERVAKDVYTGAASDVPHEFEARLRRKDGTYRWFLFRDNPLRDEQGRITRWYLSATDIEDRKRAEEALQRSEVYLAEAQRLSHTGSWAFDLASGKFVYASEECIRMYEHDAQEGLPTREATFRLIHPEDRDSVQGGFEKSLREKVDTSSEFRLVLPSGQVKHVQTIRHPVLNEAGDVVELVGTTIDITEHKRAEEALRLAGVYNRSLIEASLDPLVTIDKQGKISDVNAATEIATGYTRDELIGTDFSNYFTEPEKARAVYQQVFDRGFVRDYELEIRDWNGEITPVLYNASVYRDDTGNVIGVFAAARDITKQKRAEEARSRLAAIVESSDDAIISEDLDGTITSWNEGAERLYGYSAAEVLGRPVSVLMPPDKQDQMAGLLKRVREGIRVEHYETERVRKDGRTINVAVTLSPVRNRQGEIIGASAIVRDITERKQAQEALQKVLAELEVRVEERTKELSETNQSLQAANKELESFSYSVSHDLRAPLRAIDGFSRMVLKHYADKLDDEGRRKLNVIRSNTQKMDELINDLLAFSRLGRKEMVNTSIDMEALVQSAWRELTPANPERSIQFSVNKLPHAMGDQTLIKQVVVNLLSNTIKFSKSRELAIVEVGSYPEEEKNVYFVKDNGVGFDMQYYGKLFGVFQRLHSTDEFEGTGVGLAIVERIIRRHGGRVWAEGKMGEGATFYFTLARKE